MKYILLSILLLTTQIIFCQIKPNDIIKVYEMNFDEFETFALQHKFEFSERIKNDTLEQLIFKKCINENCQLLSLSINYNGTKIFSYSPISIKEVLKIKKWISKNGFTYYKSDYDIPEGFSKANISCYQNNEYLLSLMTAVNYNKPFYNIMLTKLF